MQPRGVLFDFDGTLYGDWKLWVSLIQETLLDFQVTVTAYEALEMARNMIRQGTFVNISGVAIAIAQDQGREKEPDIRTRFLEKLDKAMDESGPGEDLAVILDGFQRKGVKMALVTFQRRPRLERRLQAWKLTSYFQSIVTPDQQLEFKPSPEPFIVAIRELGLQPIQCYVVGDEPADMIGGKKAGARTIGLPQGFFSEEELKEAGADFIITSLKDLQEIIE